jgi:hypothetical protein
LNTFTKKREILLSMSIISSAFAGANAYAQNINTAFPTNKTNSVISTTVSTQKTDTNSELTGEVSFTSNQFLEEVGDTVGNKFFGDFNMSYSSVQEGELNKTFSLNSRVNDQEQLMFSIPEANVQYVFGNSKLTFGRKILDWGMLDGNWGMGKLNNRVNFDGFEPKQEGLTGITFDHFNRDNGFKMSLFGSVIYIPEMNPGTKIDKENGTVTCQNPWCKEPAPTADTGNGKQTPIFYNVNYPELTDVIFRYSVGARLGIDRGLVALEGYYTKKPENQLSTTAEVSVSPQGDLITADVTPQFYYHEVSGADLKLRPFKNITVYGSAYRIRPEKYPDGNEPYIQYTGIKPKKKLEEYVGGGVIFNDGEIKAGVNYIARVSEFNIEDDPLVEYPRWNQAYHVSLSAHLTRKLSVGFDYKYDMLTEDRLTMYRANYEFNPNMLVSLGANIIGSSENTDSYWSDFINNDSVFSSFKYVF